MGSVQSVGLRLMVYGKLFYMVAEIVGADLTESGTLFFE